MKNSLLKHKKSVLTLVVLSLLSIFYLVSSTRPSSPPPPTLISPSPSLSPTFVPYDLNKQERVIYKDQGQFYQIVFHPIETSYIISITGTPFLKYRQEAENAFLQQLHLTSSQACQLNVVVTTPYFANPKESGQNYSLSFCPPSIQVNE